MPDITLGAVAYGPKVVTIWEGFIAVRDTDQDLSSVVVTAPGTGGSGSAS